MGSEVHSSRIFLHSFAVYLEVIVAQRRNKSGKLVPLVCLQKPAIRSLISSSMEWQHMHNKEALRPQNDTKKIIDG